MSASVKISLLMLALVLVISGAYIVWFNRSIIFSGSWGQKSADESLGDQISEVTANPSENIPETNPFEAETNPFNVYKNPFE